MIISSEKLGTLRPFAISARFDAVILAKYMPRVALKSILRRRHDRSRDEWLGPVATASRNVLNLGSILSSIES